MTLYNPMQTDFDTFLWMQHWEARFTEEDRIRTEMEKILAKTRKRPCRRNRQVS